MQLDKAATTLRVAVPHDINAGELGRLNQTIIDKVIRGHTGCSCLSGQINVLLETQWQETIQVPIVAHGAAGE